MIPLSLAKSQLRILHNHDDELINHYIDASILEASDYLDRVIVAEPSDPVNPDERVLDSKITQAVLMLVGHFYENREAVVFTGDRVEGVEIPLGFERLLWFQRKGGA